MIGRRAWYEIHCSVRPRLLDLSMEAVGVLLGGEGDRECMDFMLWDVRWVMAFVLVLGMGIGG